MALVTKSSQVFVVNLLRTILDQFRQNLRQQIEKDWSAADIRQTVVERLNQEFDAWTRPALRRILNATGVILHTNFGRAPLAAPALENLLQVAAGYSNLEFDLSCGHRGKRDVFADRLLQKMLGCEQALVVNNCAAALFLSLNTLAEGGEVLISRGELIEIGDSFRIPDILRKSSVTLKEVGTTNRTRLSDYAQGVNDRTRLILRVHPSNFRMVGFCSRPPLQDLLQLSRQKRIPLLEDIGSGCLLNLTGFGVHDEPDPRVSLQMGVPLVCFSGDKLLGGPQAGILAGHATLIQQMRVNPLFRALRVDKLTLSVLETTVISYLKGREAEEIPLVRMIHESVQHIEQRARQVIDRLNVTNTVEISLIDGLSVIGGGSTPDRGIPTKRIAVRCPHVTRIEHELRHGNPPLLARLENDCLILDLRTVFPQDDLLVARLLQLAFDSITDHS